MWTNVSLIAELKNVETLHKCDRVCKEIGFKDYGLRYMSALDVMITFNSKADADTALNIDKEKWSSHFRSLSRWTENYAPSERLAWILIRGVPPHLREAETFDLIGNSLGTIAHASTVAMDDGWLSYERIGILTTQLNRIHDGIIIRWRDKSYKIVIEEEITPWLPDFLNLDLPDYSPPVTSPVPEYVSANINAQLNVTQSKDHSPIDCDPIHSPNGHISDSTTPNIPPKPIINHTISPPPNQYLFNLGPLSTFSTNF